MLPPPRLCRRFLRGGHDAVGEHHYAALGGHHGACPSEALIVTSIQVTADALPVGKAPLPPCRAWQWFRRLPPTVPAAIVGRPASSPLNALLSCEYVFLPLRKPDR